MSRAGGQKTGTASGHRTAWPRYTRIVDRLLFEIAAGEYRVGSFLPSVRALSRSQQVCPVTVSKAYRWLVEGGYVTARRGAGYLVSARQLEQVRRLYRQRVRQAFAEAVQVALSSGLTVEEVLAIVQRSETAGRSARPSVPRRGR